MRAAVCATYGPPEVVVIEELPPPVAGPGSVKVNISAAAVNFPDVLIVANEYQVKVPTPFVPGSEFAGEVVEVGEGVTAFTPGDRVFGTSIVGGFAEQAVVPASSINRTPDGVSDDAAAAFGVAHRTAYHALRSVAKLQPGEELVVLGAGGGVGLAAVQLGSLLGATVTAVASSARKLGAAEAMGASRLVDHSKQDLRSELRSVLPEGSHVVIDPVGGRLSEPALRSLRWGGRFVTIGYASGEIPRIPLNLVLLKGVQIVGFEFRGFASNHPGDASRNEAELMELLASGRAFPLVGETFALEASAEALRCVADAHAVGKVVVAVRAPT